MITSGECIYIYIYISGGWQATRGVFTNAQRSDNQVFDSRLPAYNIHLQETGQKLVYHKAASGGSRNVKFGLKQFGMDRTHQKNSS